MCENNEIATLSEGDVKRKTPGPTTVRIPKVNIRWWQPEAPPAAVPSRPTYERQLGIDESAEEARPAKRLPHLKGKPAAVATDGARSIQLKRSRNRPQHD